MALTNGCKLGSRLAALKPLKLALGCLCSLATMLSLSFPAMAQQFKPGEIVIYNDCGKEVEGKVIKQDQYGILVLQKHWQDGTFHADGSSQYMGAATLRSKEASPQVAGASARLGDSGPRASAGGNPATSASGAALGGSGQLSKQDIIDYLKAKIGTDGPHPGKAQVCKDLCDTIKKRGVSFKYKSSEDWEFSKAGGDTSVPYTIALCYGDPVKQNWLFGEWDVSFTRTFSYSASERDGAKMGFVAIEPDGKYLWKLSSNDPPPKWIDGKWRPATPAEMQYQGGAGIVLQGGEQGNDWIVHKDTGAYANEDWINIADINYRQTKRGGKRVPN